MNSSNLTAGKEIDQVRLNMNTALAPRRLRTTESLIPVNWCGSRMSHGEMLNQAQRRVTKTSPSASEEGLGGAEQGSVSGMSPRMSYRMSHQMSYRMSHRMSRRMSHRMSKYLFPLPNDDVVVILFATYLLPIRCIYRGSGALFNRQSSHT